MEVGHTISIVPNSLQDLLVPITVYVKVMYVLMVFVKTVSKISEKAAMRMTGMTAQTMHAGKRRMVQMVHLFAVPRMKQL